MSLLVKTVEIERLIDAFEVEAGKFHDIQFSIDYVTQDEVGLSRKVAQQNHAVMLWQYYGPIDGKQQIDQLLSNMKESDLKWGLRGAALTQFGVIEGQACQLFVRMATRAGSLFSEEEAQHIKSRVVSEIQANDRIKNQAARPTAVMNDNPLAIWLNFLLYYLSLVYPGRERAMRIEPDPFSLSLLALERLFADRTIGKVDRSARSLIDIRFKVAMSFPGEKRRYVSRVVDALREPLGKDSVFYDYDYQAQLACPNLDTLLQRIYRDQSDLIAVFLCAAYSAKQWCGLEWRAVRDIIKSKGDHRVMLVRFDNADVDGLFSIDGYIDGTANTTKQVADLILARLSQCTSAAFEKRTETHENSHRSGQHDHRIPIVLRRILKAVQRGA